MTPGSPLSAFTALLRRDLLAFWRRRADLLNPILFALMIATLFPLALGPESQKLARIAGGIVWVVVLLASLLSLDALFRTDVEDGSLDQLIASHQPLALLAAAKLFAHWLGTGLPLVVVAPLLAYLLGLRDGAMAPLVGALLLGTPLLSMIGGSCA
ncbi:MAG TPA: heme exporter protein CcmB, partial [Xanthomonadales bacterium]|nr:heme exporter protein CcmB [Xanthomonadales bacterium]